MLAITVIVIVSPTLRAQKAHCTLMSILCGIQVNVRQGDCPKQVCDLKWALILYKCSLIGAPSAPWEEHPHTLCPHWNLISSGPEGIKYVCNRDINKYSNKCECKMERITDVWRRWKTFYRRSDIEVRSKDALTEKEKSRIREFQSEETFVEN